MDGKLKNMTSPTCENTRFKSQLTEFRGEEKTDGILFASCKCWNSKIKISH